jgi:uncharacterized protein (DUF305 family)
MDPAASPSAGRGRLIVAAIVMAVVLVAVSLTIGRLTAPVQSDPTTASVEAGFARDMQVHHQQAVEMALLIRDRTDDAAVRLLAYDIANSQSQQAGQMFGWLATWGLSQAPSEPSMTWMTRPTLDGDDHAHGDGTAHEPGSPMPGMATRAQLDELATLDGVAAERLFLELMIAHHEGGVEMAEAVLERSRVRVVTDLAGSIVLAQASEIELMRSMLEERAAG